MLWFLRIQNYLIFNPNLNTPTRLPSDNNFQLTYKNILIKVPNSTTRLRTWWFDDGKTHYNNLARIKGLQKLGFYLLAFDYRSYGLSEGDLPNEF